MRKHYNITISGNLYETGFRFIAMQAAYKYKIFGTIKYNRYKNIFIQAEGDESNLNQYVDWCKKRHPGSVIEDVTVEETNEIIGYGSFDIIHGGSKSEM